MKTIVGKRVRLIRCNDPYTKLLPGSLGTIRFIDVTGTVHVKWDSGSSLGLCADAGDAYEFVKDGEDE